MDWKAILDPLRDNPSGMADTFQDISEPTLDFHALIGCES